jgi:putative oxidoreductase
MIKTLWMTATDAGQDARRMPEAMRAPLAASQDLLLLAARLFVAKAFFWSGLTKVRDWETTLALFQDEYQVPLVSPQLAALAGTGGSCCCPCCWFSGWRGASAPPASSCSTPWP